MERKDQHKSKELCLVVLGETQSGKTSLINCLLGHRDIQPHLSTANCIRHHGWLRDRKLTVVDTPGWWKGHPLIDTAQRTKYELVSSVRQCPPGPHAFILTIEVVGFTERNLGSVIEHLGLFGEDIWRHTIVVFTRGDSLEGKTIEQHIESEGTALKWLVEKCGNRFCVFDKQTKGQDQVIQLMKDIESLVNSSCGRHFQPDEKTFREFEERSDAQQTARERASVRRLQVQEKRKLLREQCAGVPRLLSEVRIVLLGWVLSGKTLARNVMLNKEAPGSWRKTEECETDTQSAGDRHITVVDTPGWWKYFSAQYTPDRVNIELQESVSLGCKSPHALLLVVPADVSFLEEQRKITEDNMTRMFGEMGWRHTIVLFTWGDSLGNTNIEEHIESEGEPLSWLIDKCGNRYHVFDNMNREDGSQVRELLEKIDELEASFNFVDMTRESPKTECTPNYENECKINPAMVDKEWMRRDKELEDGVRGLWQESFGSAGRGDRSKQSMPDFHENEVPADYGKRLPVDLPQTKTSDLKHTSAFLSEHCLQYHGLPHLPQDNREMKEKFEREWGRCKAIIMNRVRGLLLASAEEAERGPHKHGGKELKELARQCDDIMDNVQTIISEICSQSVFSSELGEEEHHQSIDKVLRWKTRTSGLGSELDIKENDDSCAE